MKFLISIILMILSTQLDLEVEYITIPSSGTSNTFYLIVFSSTDIKSKITDLNQNLDIFSFKIPSCCEIEATATSIDEDPTTKNDCGYYIRVQYTVSLNYIKLPNKLKGSNDYNILVNKALVNKEYDLIGKAISYIKPLILIEKINPSDDGSTLSLDITIPLCTSFLTEPKITATINDEIHYECTLTDISFPYNNNKKQIPCTAKSDLNRITKTTPIWTFIFYYDNYNFIYPEGGEGTNCDNYNCNIENCGSNTNIELLHISIPQQAGEKDSYIFYLTAYSSCNLGIDNLNNDLTPFNFLIPETCEKEAKAISIEQDPLKKNDCNYYIRIKYNIASTSIKIPNELIGSNKYNISVNKALINQEYNLVNNPLNTDNNNAIILIEKINNPNNGIFTINAKIPTCRKNNEIIKVNGNKEYNCLLAQTISCSPTSSSYKVDTVEKIEFDNKYIIFESKGEKGSNCYGDISDPDTDPDPDPDSLEFNEDPSNTNNIYYSNVRLSIFNIYHKKNYFGKINSLGFYAKYKSNNPVEISQFCMPSLSRYIGYALISCQIDLISIFNINDEKELINSPITIQYGTSLDDLKDYKTYYIRRIKEQQTFKDFLDTMNRSYYNNEVKNDL